MTKAEAIKILKGICHNCALFPHCVYKKPDCFRAISMAIEALQRGLENVNADSCSEKPNRSDTIYRQDAIDVVKGIDSYFVKYIEDLPSVQPEIIRCKDCKYWMPHSQLGFDEDNGVYHDYCQRLVPEDEYYAFYRGADDFCSYAERRTE